MTSPRLLPNIIRFTLPIIFTNLLQLVFSAADTIMVGRLISSRAVAAVGASGTLIGMITNLFIGLSTGAGVTMAQAAGAKNGDRMHKTVHTSVLFALIAGGVLTLIGMVFSKTFLVWMDTPPEVLALSVQYMRIYFAGALSTLVFNFAAALLRATGDSRRPMIFLSCAGALNVVLNYVFIRFLHMGVAGVAAATVLSQTFSAVLSIAALARTKGDMKLYFRRIRLHRSELASILKTGVPSGLQSFILCFSMVVIQSAVNSFGEATMAGNAAASNIENFVWVTMTSVRQPAVNFMGQNMGAGNYHRLKKIMYTCIVLVISIGIVLGPVICLLSERLLGIYITDSPEAIKAGMTRIIFLCLPFFLNGMMDVMTGCLCGVGKSAAAMIISICSTCFIRLFWVYVVFAAVPTLRCLYLSFPVSWILTFAIDYAVFIKTANKYIKSTPCPNPSAA